MRQEQKLLKGQVLCFKILKYLFIVSLLKYDYRYNIIIIQLFLWYFVKSYMLFALDPMSLVVGALQSEHKAVATYASGVLKNLENDKPITYRQVCVIFIIHFLLFWELINV
uniref:Importin subunit beta-1 n=1 Tax=Heterorhabditis bacteriophora TaxID=37862 RepID=A0A1I7WKN2_HETBA